MDSATSLIEMYPPRTPLHPTSPVVACGVGTSPISLMCVSRDPEMATLQIAGIQLLRHSLRYYRIIL